MSEPHTPSEETSPPGDVLDRIVLAAADGDWRKVAVFIAKVMDTAKADDVESSGQAIAQRVYALVEAGKLEARGNVRRWRAGEIRLPQASEGA